MSEREELQKRYAYHEMSNKVEQADRSLLRNRKREPTGEVETLRGRTDIGRMGDRTITATSSSSNTVSKTKSIQDRLAKKNKRNKTQSVDDNANKRRRRGGVDVVAAAGGQTILDLGDLTGYQPSTERAKNAYEELLSIMGSRHLLGNQSTSVLRDAAEILITTLKDQDLRDPERHEAISKLLTSKSKGVSKEQFATFVQLGKQLDDYDDWKNNSGNNNNNNDANNVDRVDDEMGVAVVFDDSDEDDDDNNNNNKNNAADDDSDIEQDVVVDDESSSSSEDEGNNQDDDEEQAAVPIMGDSDSDNDDKLVQGVDVDEKSKKKSGGGSGSSHYSSDRVLSVHEIDAHYLQRQLSKYYPDDANQAADMSKQVLSILDIRNNNNNLESSNNYNTDLRECENKLLVLLGFDAFDTIKLLLRNRLRVWACVSLKRAGGSNSKQVEEIEQILISQTGKEGIQIHEELHSKGEGFRAQDWTKECIKQRTAGSGELFSDSNNKNEVTKALDSVVRVKSENNDINDDNNKMDIDNNNANEKDSAKPLDLDLESLIFRDGSHTMSNKKCNLPDTSWRAMKKGYEEVHVPAIQNIIPKDEKLIEISKLPKWTHAAFEGMDKLNRVQSKMCDVALRTSENLLLCAPTGAGKTNVACLTMLNILGQYRKVKSEDENNNGSEDDDDEDNKEDMFDLQSFKIVYIAPMKALVQEVVKNFSDRLKSYGVVVRELSGDSSLSRQQIAETQLLVTTPEKWDIVTRQGEGRAYTQLVKLVIIDEIHLLHDERGPVLESIVARVIRQVETNAEPIRLVGLSATLPNYADVATFLRVKPDKGMFFFDHSFRPVPLQMQYVGITERNAFKRFQLQNEICYEKCLIQRKNGSQQVLIFVHSRAETGKTAKALRDMAMDRDEMNYYVREGRASQEILREEAQSVDNPDLKDVLPYGFAIHHAGMGREDRAAVEDLFAGRHIAVLCTTATLAWGVNLPAHAVIIRGTQIYDPAKGRWAELSPLDVLQMLGRAGRPQYDSEGEGIILTQHSELQYYLSLTNLQLPVESQFIKTLADHLNAEVVLGTVQSLEDAVIWLSYTFLYIRMLRNPELYGILNPEVTLQDDPTLKRRRLDLAHTAASILEKNHLIRYDRKSGALHATPLGRVASQFYISHSSMAVYSRHMRPNMSDIELLRLFALSGEFNHITVREEEKLELTKLVGKVPIPVKESPSEPSAKINILLQSYISRLRLDGFALVADMAFVQQSGARIMRALFEIALRRKWANLARLCLNMANMVAYRIWRSQSPLRQFKNVPEIVARKLERKSDIEWARYPDLTTNDLGELVGVPKMGRVLHKFVHQFPRLELSAQIQPITRSMLRVELTLIPAFHFDILVHGYVQMFHVIVEDVNCETILHNEVFSLKAKDSEEEHVLMFYVPILDPLPPAYFVRVVSDRWLHSESVLPISFSNMILPAKFPPPTELLDLQPLLPSALGEPALSSIFTTRRGNDGANIKEFNPIQTQTFHELFKTDRNCLVCAPSGSGKTVCAEFAILRMLISNPNGKCVYVAPTDEIADPIHEQWNNRLGSILQAGKVTRLTGTNTAHDLKLLAEGKIVVASVKQWDMISRRWRQRKAVQAVSLVIFDELHFLGGDCGPTMEVVISRMRYIGAQQQSSQKQKGASAGLRVLGLSASIANAREVAEWMGVPTKSLFNFSSKVRPFPLEIYFQSFEQNNYSARLMAMAKPVYDAVTRYIGDKSAIVYVPSRRQAQLTSIDLMSYRESQGAGVGGSSASFLGNGLEPEEMSRRIAAGQPIVEPTLQQVMACGIGYLHAGMVESDWSTVLKLYREGVLTVLVCPAGLCWKVHCRAHLVVIMGTEAYDGRERRHVDYPIADVLHMMGRHDTDQGSSSGKCVILCHSPKKERLKKLLYDPLPIESHLDSYLHDHFNSEIVTKTIETMQDAVDYLTWTFLYRRLPKNPTYYGMRGASNAYISEHLSEMVETVLGDLEESKCCKISDDTGEASPLNLGMIAAYYYVQYRTIELIASSVTPKTKVRGVLEIVSASWEFANLPIRYGEEKALKILARNLTHKVPDNASYSDSNTKTLILLQCHFSRKPLSVDLRIDQNQVLIDSVNLIQAIVDVISSNGWLKPALAAMELSQMIVQGLWNRDHVLKQIPHFTDEIIRRCLAHEGEDAVDSVFDILTLDDDVRNDLLRLPDEKMADVAHFCNNYPNIEVSYEVQDPDDLSAGSPVQVVVNLEREVDEDEEDEEQQLIAEEIAQLGTVAAPLFPAEKKESWWIVIGDIKTNTLYSLKRIALKQKQKVALEFLAPEEPGDYELTLFCMSDSYLGCDQEYSVALSVAAADDDDDEDETDSSSEEE